MQSFALTLFADYHQFYIKDEAAQGDLSDCWDAAASARLLALAPGTIGVGTVRDVEVPVTIEIYDREPDADVAAWDHVVEAGLSVASGPLVVAGCTDYLPDAKRIPLAPGNYRVRISYGGLETVSEDGLEAADRYRLQLWPAPAAEPRIVKQRAGS
jgi:hypothetical protein